MKAAVLHTLGHLPNFEVFPDPVPEENESLIHVRAAALKPVDRQMASGAHYGSYQSLPVVCGIDGVGTLASGDRVYFAGPRRPYGAMAELSVAPKAFCWPLPAAVNDETAAALINPGMSAWLTLTWRAKLAAGESVLVLGATGVTGRLAVQVAKVLGASRVVAAGRNAEALGELRHLGADAIIPLVEGELASEEMTASFVREAGGEGYKVIVDYVWGKPTEALLAALTQRTMTPKTGSIRLVQAGESAGPTITLPAAALRSSGLEILGSGTGSMPPREVLEDTFAKLMDHAAQGTLNIETETVALSEIGEAWQRNTRRRIVVVP